MSRRRRHAKAAPEPTIAVSVEGAPSSYSVLSRVGVTGLKHAGGRVYQEWHPKLQPGQDMRAFAEMRDDPIVGAALLFMETWIRKTAFRVTPSDESRATAVQCAQRLDMALHDMAHTFSAFISDACTMIPFGFAPCEMIWKQCLGQNPGTYVDANGSTRQRPPSKYSDGLYAWHKIQLRGQETVDHWEFDDVTDEILGFWQLDPYAVATGANAGLRFVPREKFLHFRTTAQLDNPQGRALLRPAYDPHFFGKKLKVIEAIKHEKNAIGTLVGFMPLRYLSTNATGDEAEVVGKVFDQMTGYRVDSQMGMVWPAKEEKDGKTGWDIDVLRGGGDDKGALRETIRGHDHDKAIALASEMIFLGLSKVGTQTVASEKKGTLGYVLEAIADIICDTFNADAASKFALYNGWSHEDIPLLTHGRIVEPSLEEVGNFVRNTGLPMHEGLEAFLTTLLGAPPREGADLDVG